MISLIVMTISLISCCYNRRSKLNRILSIDVDNQLCTYTSYPMKCACCCCLKGEQQEFNLIDVKSITQITVAVGYMKACGRGKKEALYNIRFDFTNGSQSQFDIALYQSQMIEIVQFFREFNKERHPVAPLFFPKRSIPAPQKGQEEIVYSIYSPYIYPAYPPIYQISQQVQFAQLGIYPQYASQMQMQIAPNAGYFYAPTMIGQQFNPSGQQLFSQQNTVQQPAYIGQRNASLNQQLYPHQYAPPSASQ
ncbi:MAG: hypothetical protein EZS28_027559, partial [Streblomastix strix]